MNPETRYGRQRIDHLRIVTGICSAIGLIEEIGPQVGASEQNVSHGQGGQAIVLLIIMGLALLVYTLAEKHPLAVV
jgi:hypothetical protein